MTTQATYDDVNLILRLYELRRESRMRTAREWFATQFRASTLEEFERLCPPGSEESAYFRMVTSYWDMAASFITNGVLHQELFFQSGGELLLVWERLKDLAPALRERTRNPLAYRNLETVAQAYVQWLNRNAPGAYEQIAARLKSS